MDGDGNMIKKPQVGNCLVIYFYPIYVDSFFLINNNFQLV